MCGSMSASLATTGALIRRLDGALDPQLGPARRRDPVGVSVAVREQRRGSEPRAQTVTRGGCAGRFSHPRCKGRNGAARIRMHATVSAKSSTRLLARPCFRSGGPKRRARITCMMPFRCIPALGATVTFDDRWRGSSGWPRAAAEGCAAGSR
jgi:hypothetical protein